MIGFIGFGKMAKAITKGLCSLDKNLIINVYDINKEAISQFELKNQIQILPSIEEMEKRSSTIIFAVKPKDLKDVIIKTKGYSEKHYISIAAGISTKTILEWNSNIKNLARVMPNLGAFSNHSVSAIFSLNQETLKLTKSIFDKIGITIILDNEELMHAITGLSGSGPAYVLLFLQAMIEAGIREGLTYELSYDAAINTILGTTKILLDYNKNNKTYLHPAELIKNVTSPGGTTIEGLSALEKNHFKFAVYDAIHQATQKSRELGK
ncbi:MAG: pyrroline-5-carboxylate reductase [Leptospiraceae bacterium]|nr:MAG: pyrroline-5-carboxylate reductase [Leptospiraceae bacterium]